MRISDWSSDVFSSDLRQLDIGLHRPADIARRVIAGVQSAGGQPVAKLVIMGGYGEDHAHLERLAISVELRGDRLQRGGRDRMQDLAVLAFGKARLAQIGIEYCMESACQYV